MTPRPIHGESYSPEYRAWQQMRLRCTDPEHEAWSDYGARGIAVCDRWLASVEAFVEDMGRKPSVAHQLERIDNDKGYEPGNCRWATRSEQARNRRSNHTITVGDLTLTIAGWAERNGITHTTITKRLGAGWDPQRAVSQPTGPSGPKARVRS